jgi:glutamate N-acetyltransferase/amino-acid N-acetyltransferase
MSGKELLPSGFQAAGIACGIKQDATRADLALFVSELPAAAAGVFTQNRVCGAPVHVSRGRVPSQSARAVIINSGNANACTGQRGMDDAVWMTDSVAERLGCRPDEVLVCSTGVIGHFLPRDKLAAGIPVAFAGLDATQDAFAAAARAIMTTDTVPKQAVREVTVAGKKVRVSGAAKGAAMIAPNMATMLAVIMTDAELSPEAADAILRHAVDRSFNCISVEGHTSTSDSVILLANGTAETGPLDEDGRQTLQQTIDTVAEELAIAIVRDAEGADHLITIDVRGLASQQDAHLIARTVAESPLVKTAVTGADPNWGRIVSAVGYAGVELAEDEITLKMNGTLIYESGAPVSFDERAVSQSMRSSRDVHIELAFPLGNGAARFWTSDLTTEYVRLNSEYTT